eukprot:TRINITY_DN60586_c0_g1_i1.p1 TRINITY_DN60586_c0_g1~~TRINITY_DN60586_c0_g1_i1.p1  ORF type:complete len:537 (+),score=18.05 TRINITY_DN60586_c0_g1_i1:108-1613(+)
MGCAVGHPRSARRSRISGECTDNIPNGVHHSAFSAIHGAGGRPPRVPQLPHQHYQGVQYPTSHGGSLLSALTPGSHMFSVPQIASGQLLPPLGPGGLRSGPPSVLALPQAGSVVDTDASSMMSGLVATPCSETATWTGSVAVMGTLPGLVPPMLSPAYGYQGAAPMWPAPPTVGPNHSAGFRRMSHSTTDHILLSDIAERFTVSVPTPPGVQELRGVSEGTAPQTDTTSDAPVPAVGEVAAVQEAAAAPVRLPTSAAAPSDDGERSSGLDRSSISTPGVGAPSGAPAEPTLGEAGENDSPGYQLLCSLAKFTTAGSEPTSTLTTKKKHSVSFAPSTPMYTGSPPGFLRSPIKSDSPGAGNWTDGRQYAIATPTRIPSRGFGDKESEQGESSPRNQRRSSGPLASCLKATSRIYDVHTSDEWGPQVNGSWTPQINGSRTSQASSQASSQGPSAPVPPQDGRPERSTRRYRFRVKRLVSPCVDTLPSSPPEPHTPMQDHVSRA